MTSLKLLCLLTFIKNSLCYYGSSEPNDLMQKKDNYDYSLKLNDFLTSNNLHLKSVSADNVYSKLQRPKKSKKYQGLKNNQRGFSNFDSFYNQKKSKSQNETNLPRNLILMLRKTGFGVSCNDDPEGECTFVSDCRGAAVISLKNIECYNSYPNLDLVCCDVKYMSISPTLSSIPDVISKEVFETDSYLNSNDYDTSISSMSFTKSRSKKKEPSIESYEKWLQGSKVQKDEGKTLNKKNTKKDISIASFEQFEKEKKIQENLAKTIKRKKLRKKDKKRVRQIKRNGYLKELNKWHQKRRPKLYKEFLDQGRYRNEDKAQKKRDVFIIPSDLIASDNTDLVKKVVILQKTNKNIKSAEISAVDIPSRNY